MAFLQSKKKKDPTLSQGTTTLGASTPQSQAQGQGTVAAPAPANTPKKSNTGWTNLSQYLSANKGSGQAMGQKIGQKVDTLSSTANRRLEDYGAARTAEAKAQKVDFSGIAKDIKDNPTSVNKEDFQAATKTEYKGPKSFGGGNSYQGVVSSQQALGKATAGQGSQLNQNLVKSVYDRDSYSRGSKNLDGFLFGQSQGNGDIVNRAAKAWQDHQAIASKTQEAVNEAISKASGQVAAEVKAVNDAYNEKREALKKKIDEANDGLEAKNTAQDEAKDELIRKLKERDGVEHQIDWNGDGKVGGPDDLAVYDTIRGAIDNLEGYDWGKFVNSNKAFGLGDVVDDATQTDWKAILGLTDDTDGYTFTKGGSNAGINMDMVKKAGDYYKTWQAVQNAQKAAQNQAGDNSYLVNAVRNNDFASLDGSGISQEDFNSMRYYHDYVGDIADLGIGVKASTALGDVASLDQQKLLQDLGAAMGLRKINFNHQLGGIKDRDSIMGKLRGLNDIERRRREANQYVEDKDAKRGEGRGDNGASRTEKAMADVATTAANPVGRVIVGAATNSLPSMQDIKRRLPWR